MKNKKFLHRISLLLAFIMIFQLIPMSVFAEEPDARFPSAAYDAGGSMNIDVQYVGDLIDDWGTTIYDCRAEVSKGTNKIYLRFNYDCDVYSMVNYDAYDSFTKNQWKEVDLSIWPFDSNAYPDIDINDADDYRTINFINYETWRNGSLLIHLVDSSGGGSEEADKSSLSAEMDRVAGDNADDWYQEDDRYNGKEYLGADGSFWANMQSTLTVAQSVYEDVDSSQETVNQSVYGLKDSIDNLIPIVNINTTELYEAIKEAQDNPPEPFLHPDFTQVSWSRYYGAVDEAQELLDSLYDEDGEPNSINDSSDTDMLEEIEDKIDNIAQKRATMDHLLNEDDTNDAKLKYNTLEDLLDVYNLESMEEVLYTEDSWNDFVQAYESTEQYLDNNSAPGEGAVDGEVGEAQYEEIQEQYEILWRSIHGLEDKKERITVTIKVVDSLHARLGEDLNDKAGIHTVTLEGDKTLNTAIDTLNNEVLSSEDNSTFGTKNFYATSINGILATDVDTQGRGIRPLRFKSPIHGEYGEDYYDIQLHDGDVVTLAFLEQPIRPQSSGGASTGFYEYSLHDQYKQSAILKDNNIIEKIIEVDEGQKIELSAIYTLPHISTYSRRAKPLAGSTIFVSEEAETLEDVSPSDINTEVVTGAAGDFTYGFYSPGYYALSIYDLRENDEEEGFEFKETAPGLTIGDTIYFHVNAISQEQLLLVKEDLKEELTELYKAYPESFFSTEDWVEINSFYETAISDIDEAEVLKTAKEAQDMALNGIKDIQTKTVKDNNTKLKNIRDILFRLPDDASLLGQENAFLAEGLLESYDNLSEYQRNQLMGLEVNKYTAIKEVYENGLPELEPYELEININADTQEAEEVIEEMVAYLQANGTFSEYENTRRLNEFDYYERVLGEQTRINRIFGVTSSYPDDQVSLGFDIGYYAYYLVRDADEDFTDENVFSVEGASWTISDEKFELDTENYEHITYRYDEEGKKISISNSYFEVLNNFAIKIKGEPYEVKSVEYEGIESNDVTLSWSRLQDETNYKGKDPDRFEVGFMDSELSFVMPYNDVSVTINWGPVNDSGNPDDSVELSIAKSNAIEEIEDKYAEYRSRDYTNDGWLELTTAKNTGLDEVRAATSINAVTVAKEAAIAAMAAVEIKPVEGTIPDFGDVLGTVDVYVENTTYSDGAFTGTIVSEEGFEYAENDTMMTIILRALAENGYSWTGTGGSKPKGIDDYEIEYLASITKDGEALGEFDGTAGSGWMGTLNDFFVNEGFQQFSVDNEKLSSGDEIRAMFTLDLGVDLGGTWGNSDTSLARLQLSAGELYPSFSSSINEYTLMLPSGTKKLKVTPTASNKNYLVKTFLNDKVTSNAEGVSLYKRTQYIPVRSGDYINIGVGEYAWPSMNNQETETRDYTGTWYKLNIITPDKGAEHIIALINELPSAKRITLSDEDTIKEIRKILELLTSSEQSKVTNIQKLIDAENRIAFYKEIGFVKELLSKIPEPSNITLDHKEAIMEAYAAYMALTDNQKLYITVGDVKNYNAAIDKLTELGAFDNGGDSPSKIEGNEEILVIGEAIEGNIVDITPETKVENGKASSKVTEDQIRELLEEIKGSDVTGIRINGAKGIAKDNEILKSNVNIPKTSLENISKEKLDLNIETVIGTIEIPKNALEKIVEQAKGRDVDIVIDKVEEEKLTQEQKAMVEDDVVYDISIISNQNKISSFGGNEITISLPYELKEGQTKDRVSVWYLNDEGELEKVQCTYDEETGIATFTTDHLSYYIVGYDKSIKSISFIDVKEDDWFYQSVIYAVEKGLFKGTSEESFSPNLPMTRAMFVTVIHRLEGMPEGASSNRFMDVIDGEWYTEAVNWSSEKEIVKGVTDTEFKPENNVTREQLTVILYKYARLKGFNTEVKGNIEVFTDKQNISSWAKEAVEWAVGNGLLTGKENNILEPLGNATRAEVATILQRFMENVK